MVKNGQDIPGATGNELEVTLETGVRLPQNNVYRLSLNLNDGTCPRLGIANVNYYKRPELPDDPIVLSQCEDPETADGLSLFNLTQIESQLVGNDPTLRLTTLKICRRRKSMIPHRPLTQQVTPIKHRTKRFTCT